MKLIVLLALFFPFYLSAQDSTAACVLRYEKDLFTHEEKISTGFISLKGGSLTVDADSKELVFLFTIEQENICLDQNTVAEFYFEGLKSKTQARNAGTMNCNGLFQLVFKNSQNTPVTLLQRLGTKKLTQIIFSNEAVNLAVINIPPDTQEKLMQIISCICSDSKKLLLPK